MAASERFRAWFPGVFRISAEEQRALTVRQASADLYGSAPYNSSTVVPRLDVARASGRDTEQMIETNPILAGPMWEVAFRTGALPIKVYRLGDDPDDDRPGDEADRSDAERGRFHRHEAMDHPGYELLDNPNADITRNLFVAGTVASMFIYRKCGWLKVRRRPMGPPDPKLNPIEELWPLPGHQLHVTHNARRLITGYELRTAGRPVETFRPDEVVLHRLMPDPRNWADSMTPYSAIADAGGWFGAAGFSMERLFTTALLQRLYLWSEEEFEPDVRERIKGELQAAANTPGAIPFLEGGSELRTAGNPPGDEMLHNALKAADDVARRVLGLPEDRSDLAALYSQVIQPITQGMEQEMVRSLFRTEWEDDKAFPRFHGLQITLGTPKERADLHARKILTGQETPNEARATEDEAPKEGGDDLFVPLNMVLAKDLITKGNAVPRKRDSADGQGGDEGRGPGGTATLSALPNLPKAAGGSSPELPRARVRQSDLAPEKMRTAGQRNWETHRNRTLTGRGDSTARRLRGRIQEEHERIRGLAFAPGANPSSEAATPSLDADAISVVLDETDREVSTLLESSMMRAATDAFQGAGFLLSDAEVDTMVDYFNRPPELPESTQVTITTRVRDMVSTYRARRAAKLTELQGQPNAAEFIGAFREAWNTQADHLAVVIAETETAWAFERAAAVAWEAQGFGEVVVVGSAGTECSSGRCEEIVGQQYRTLEVPTPLHPGCRHYIVPAVLAG